MTLKLQFVLEAIDRSTAQIDRINKSIDRVTEPARRVRASLNAMLDASRMDRVRGAMAELGERAGGLMAWAQGVMALAGGIALAAGGAFFALKRTADEVDALADQAGMLKVPIETLQRLQVAAEMSGSNAAEMGEALQFLSVRMAAALGGNQEAIESFAKVGLGVRDLRRLGLEGTLLAVADKFQEVGDAGTNAQKKLAWLRENTGRSSAGLVQTLDQGSRAIRQFGDRADLTGQIISTRTAAAVGELNDQYGGLFNTLRRQRAEIAEALAPAVTDLMNRLQRWVVSNRAVINSGFAKFLEDLEKRLPAFLDGLRAVGAVLWNMAVGINRVAQLFGGWDNVIAGLAALLVGKGVFALALFTKALWGVAAAFLATPFGMFAAGITALAGLATFVYLKWEPISKFFRELFADIAAGFNRLQSLMPSWLPRLPQLTADGRIAGAAAPAATAAPSAVAARQPGPVAVGGTLRIELDAEGVPRVRQVKQDPGSALAFDVYAGKALAY